MPDFIDDFVAFTEGLSSPPLFRQWSAIGCIAGALEQRVWAVSAGDRVYPNLFVLLTAYPGVGKSTPLRLIERLWAGTGALAIGSTSITRAAMADELMAGKRVTMIEATGEILEFHSLQIIALEFGNFLPKSDSELMPLLNHIYDNPPSYKEGRRTIEAADRVNTKNPQLTILAGTTPGHLGGVIPEAAWSQGFASRLCVVYAPSGPKVDPWGRKTINTDLWRSLQDRCKVFTGLVGEMEWSDEAIDFLRPWWAEDLPPIPSHPRLAHYCPRRIVTLIKLCIVSSISRGAGDFTINELDASRAKGWLLEIEAVMDKIFEAPREGSDGGVLEEAREMLWTRYSESGSSIPKAELLRWLSGRVPANKLAYMIDTMTAMGTITWANGGIVPADPGKDLKSSD